MKIQIIIPCINLWAKYTKPCIESVNTAMVAAGNHGINTRILLVDNASTDETLVEAGKMVSEVFAHKRNEERWGFQRSVNYGVNDAFERGFDLALVLNNDTILHPEAIWRLADAFGKSFEADGRPLLVGMATAMDVRGEMTEKLIAPHHIARLVAQDNEETPVALHPNFSCFALNKECWKIVGEFDEQFYPAYFEDNDYHYRMKLAGIDAIVYPPALFYHYGSRTQVEGSENKQPVVPSFMFENNRAMYGRKWGGQPGQEKFEHPFDNESLIWSDTEQSSKGRV